MQEEWRDIPGFEGHYKVSNMGNVLSVERTCIARHERRVRQRLLKKSKVLRGGKLQGLRVKLSLPDGKHLHASIARLMLVAFVGDESDKVAHYKDGNPENLTIENLEWSTFREIAIAAPNGGYAPPAGYWHASPAPKEEKK